MRKSVKVSSCQRALQHSAFDCAADRSPPCVPLMPRTAEQLERVEQHRRE